MRADLVLDMTGTPGERFTVIDPFYRGLEYRLLDLVYDDAPPLREHPLDWPIRLPTNTMPEPDLAAAERHEVTFQGGMMGEIIGGGGGMMRGGMMGEMMGGMMRGASTRASGGSTAWPRQAMSWSRF
jgi:hypothetical protein